MVSSTNGIIASMKISMPKLRPNFPKVNYSTGNRVFLSVEISTLSNVVLARSFDFKGGFNQLRSLHTPYHFFQK